MTDDTPREDPPMAASCEHYWANHTKGGFGLCVRICQLCRTVDWDDLLGELRRVYGAAPSVVANTYAPESEWLERKSYDELNDDLVQELYDRLVAANETIAAYEQRTRPETWQRQADEIGRLVGQLDDRDQTIARVRETAESIRFWARRDVTPQECADSVLAALDGDTPKEH